MAEANQQVKIQEQWEIKKQNQTILLYLSFWNQWQTGTKTEPH